MPIVVEARACSIIRNLLVSMPNPRGVILLPANICPVVPLTLLTVGRAFEFIDIDGDLGMDRRLVRQRLESPEPRVAGIIYVRTYGVPGDLSESIAEWKESDAERVVIDDRCLSPPEPGGTDLQGADAALFSTGYGKYLDLGSGGFAHLDRGTAYNSGTYRFDAGADARLTAYYKRHLEAGTTIAGSPSGDPDHPMHAFPDWIPSRPQRVAADPYLKRIAAGLYTAADHKERINETYRRRIPESVQLAEAYCRWRFQIRAPNKAALLDRIFGAGHFASGHYYPASRLFGGRSCRNAEDLYRDIVNLFNDFHTTVKQATDVADIVCRHLDEAHRSSDGI